MNGSHLIEMMSNKKELTKEQVDKVDLVKGKYVSSLLHHAVAHNKLKSVQLLIDGGIDINIKDKTDWSVIHQAAYYGQLEMVKLLIDNKANINIQNGDGWTALHCAIEERKLDVIKLLLKNKADTSIKNNDSLTSPLKAISDTHLDTTMLLIDFIKSDTLKAASQMIIERMHDYPWLAADWNKVFNIINKTKHGRGRK